MSHPKLTKKCTKCGKPIPKNSPRMCDQCLDNHQKKICKHILKSFGISRDQVICATLQTGAAHPQKVQRLMRTR